MEQLTVELQEGRDVVSSESKRLAAIMIVHGMWKDDPDKPHDSVAYQREVRAEWPDTTISECCVVAVGGRNDETDCDWHHAAGRHT